jgi:hypothetical protein
VVRKTRTRAQQGRRPEQKVAKGKCERGEHAAPGITRKTRQPRRGDRDVMPQFCRPSGPDTQRVTIQGLRARFARAGPWLPSSRAFGAASSRGFGAASARVFGAASARAFGAASACAFGAASARAFFGAAFTCAFGAASTRAFGAPTLSITQPTAPITQAYVAHYASRRASNPCVIFRLWKLHASSRNPQQSTKAER